MPVEVPNTAESVITPATALKASQVATKLEDVTDNDPRSPLGSIIAKHGYPKTQFELDGLKLLSDDTRREKRLSVIKSVLFAIISLVPSILLYLMGTT